MQEEKKENDLLMKEMKQEIEELKMKAISSNNYKDWTYKEILIWIISITDKENNKPFIKYKEILSKELQTAQLGGPDLETIEKSDLKDFGINIYKDRQYLHKKIQELVGTGGSNNNDNNDNGQAMAVNNNDDNIAFYEDEGATTQYC